jgi:hypothetical protein
MNELVMHLRALRRAANFFAIKATLSFPMGTVFHGFRFMQHTLHRRIMQRYEQLCFKVITEVDEAGSSVKNSDLYLDQDVTVLTDIFFI